MSYEAMFGTAGFNIEAEDAYGTVAGWTAQPNIIVTSIPGSNPPITEVEIVWPQGPSRATWRVNVDNQTDYLALVAKTTSIDTLIVPRRVQAHAGSELSGQVYLPHTMLLSMGPPAARIDGSIEVDCTFMRQLDPATGEAVAMNT